MSKGLFPTSQKKREVKNGVVNVDRDQLAILCPIILLTGAPRQPSSNTRFYVSAKKATEKGKEGFSRDHKKGLFLGTLPPEEKKPSTISTMIATD